MPTPHSCESLIFLFQKYYGLEGDKRTSAESRLCWQAGLVMYWTISTGLESPSHSSHALCDEASVSSEVLSSPSLWGSHSQNYALGWSSHKADVRAVLNYDFNCTETEMCEMYSATEILFQWWRTFFWLLKRWDSNYVNVMKGGVSISVFSKVSILPR